MPLNYEYFIFLTLNNVVTRFYNLLYEEEMFII